MTVKDTYFNKRVVAFLDVLGFKNLIAQAESSPAGFARFQSLLAVIESRVRWGNDDISAIVPDYAQPVYTFISDSIIISAPLNYESTSDSSPGRGINLVAIKVIQIAQKLLELGYLVRGGIAVGNAIHSSNNIFGSGYIDAYSTEQAAKDPCILLHPSAIEELRRDSSHNEGTISSEVWLRDHDRVIINTLSIIHGIHGLIENRNFEIFRTHIVATLSKLELGCAERQKWEWYVNFFNRALKGLFGFTSAAPAIENIPFPSNPDRFKRLELASA